MKTGTTRTHSRKPVAHTSRSQRAHKWLAGGVLAALAALIMAGCSNGDPGLTQAQVQETVRTELDNASQSGLTDDDVDAAVQAALADMPTTGPGLTAEDVEAAVQAALADMPTTGPGLTVKDVEDTIQARMDEMPQPEPGLTSDDAEQIARGVVAQIPPRSDPAAYTGFFVQNAISRYETLGLDATLAHYNRTESVDGQWYVFIVDQDDLVLAHPDGSLAGLDLKGPLGTDANGYNFGREMLSATKEGRWVSYVYGNPETRPAGAAFGELQFKNSWVVRHDGLLFGSGWYVDADEFTKSFVATAVSRFRRGGLEGTAEYFTGSESDFAGMAAAIDYYNSVETVEGKWSAFIADSSGTIVDHYDKSKVGRDLEDLFGVAMFEASPEGNWVTTESLHIWVVQYDGMVFGSGWRQDEPG